MRPIPDRDAIEKARGGGPDASDAFRELYERHVESVYEFLRRVLWERDLVDDAVQEAFLRLFKSLKSYDLERPFKPFLFKLAHRAALDLLRNRRRKPRPESLIEEPEGSEASASQEASRHEVETLIDASLRALAPEHRAILTLRHRESLKMQEIAHVLGCSGRTARTRLQTAGVLFERELRKRHVFEGEA